MRRACEVAVGRRNRRKPFVETSYRADPDNEVRRYHSEDDRVTDFSFLANCSLVHTYKNLIEKIKDIISYKSRI